MLDDQAIRAIGVDGNEVYFTDYVHEGEEVTLWDDPEVEHGFRGIYILYKDSEGEWRLRHRTQEENEAALEKARAEALRAIDRWLEQQKGKD